MKLNVIFLLLFLICSTFCVVGSVSDNETVFLVAKTMVFPTIIFYYFDLTKKVNYLFVFSLFLFYLADVFIILDLMYLKIILGIILNISHLIFLKLSIQDYHKTKKNGKTLLLSILVFLIVQVIHLPIFVMIYDFNFNLAITIVISAMIVSSLCALGFYNYSTTKSKSSLYFLWNCVFMVLMYLSYEVYKYIYFIAMLKYLSLVCKLATYFFVVKYMIFRDENKNLETDKIKV